MQSTRDVLEHFFELALCASHDVAANRRSEVALIDRVVMALGRLSDILSAADDEEEHEVWTLEEESVLWDVLRSLRGVADTRERWWHLVRTSSVDPTEQEICGRLWALMAIECTLGHIRSVFDVIRQIAKCDVVLDEGYRSIERLESWLITTRAPASRQWLEDQVATVCKALSAFTRDSSIEIGLTYPDPQSPFGADDELTAEESEPTDAGNPRWLDVDDDSADTPGGAYDFLGPTEFDRQLAALEANGGEKLEFAETEREDLEADGADDELIELDETDHSCIRPLELHAALAADSAAVCWFFGL